MSRKTLAALLFVASATLSVERARAEDPTLAQKEDVIYGRKFGTALTLDVFTPKKNAHGAAIVMVISGGWFSDHAGIPFWMGLAGNELVKRELHRVRGSSRQPTALYRSGGSGRPQPGRS